MRKSGQDSIGLYFTAFIENLVT